MKLRHFAISQQGSSHIRKSTNCQDFSRTADVRNEKLNLDMAVAAIADGVGSCDFSEDGSRIAVTTALEYLCRKLPLLEAMSDDAVLSLIKESFRKADSCIEDEATTRSLPYLLFDTTLTIAVLTEQGTCYVGHIGDDGIVALFTDGSYSMITARIEGEEANSVFPLSSKKYWTFGVSKKPVAALALMTDGLLDKSVGSARMNNRVYYPFFKPMFENLMESDEDASELRDFWNDYLGDSGFRRGYGVTDDITLVVVQVPELLKKVTPLPFDEAKWNRETEEARARTEEALNRSSGAAPEPSEDTPEPASAAAPVIPDPSPAEIMPDPSPAENETEVPFVRAADADQALRQSNPQPLANPAPVNPGQQEDSPMPDNPGNSRSRKLRLLMISAAVIVLAAAAGLIIRNRSLPRKNDQPVPPAATATAATATDLTSLPEITVHPGGEPIPEVTMDLTSEPVISLRKVIREINTIRV